MFYVETSCYLAPVSSQRTPLQEQYCSLRFVGSLLFASPASFGRPEVAFKIQKLEKCRFFVCFANPGLSETRFSPQGAFKGEVA
jgi:hypothetical protein